MLILLLSVRGTLLTTTSDSRKVSDRETCEVLQMKRIDREHDSQV
ncbi:hypothetical protein AVEN_19989-1, partial [Araneus ventricosus]